MSAVQRALNVELPAQWAENHVAPARPMSRWGPPIWVAEEFAESLRSTPTDALPLEITLLAFVYNYR